MRLGIEGQGERAGAVKGHFLRQMREWSGGRGRNDKEMGAEIFAEAETGTRYGFISRSPKGERRKGEGAERKEGKRESGSKWPFVMT